MLYLVEPSLRAKAQALPFVERYGGIAHALTAKFPAADNTLTTATFPVSTALSAEECFNRGKYVNLVPNDAYKSVCYFEGLNSAARVTPDGPQAKIADVQQTVRFVCWLNMKALGYTDFEDVGLMALAAVKTFSGLHAINIDGKIGRLLVSSLRVILDRQAVFGQYTYWDKQAFFMWPFAFFAVEMECRLQLPMGCIEAIGLPEPIECITQW